MELYHSFRVFPSSYFVFYYLIVLCTFIYVSLKFRNDLVIFIIILTFYNGLFAYFGGSIWNSYKIFIFCLTIFAVIRAKVFSYDLKGYSKIIVFFIVYSVIFFISGVINENKFLLVTSQYSKFLIPFLLFFIFIQYSNYKPLKLIKLNDLFLNLLVIQILLAVAKLFIFGMLESIVGSISYEGGALATVYPIVGFIFLWIVSKDNFVRAKWFLILGLLFIGFMSNKRAIWFIMPLIIFLFVIFIPKYKFQFVHVVYLLFTPFIFYLGVRLIPSLNREQKIWGTFNYDYALDFATTYSFGKEDYGARDEGQGRGGVTLLLFNNLFKTNFYTGNNLLGFGFDEIFVNDYEKFDKKKFGVNSKGSITGAFQSYISIGILGLIAFLFYSVSLIKSIKNPKILIIFLGIYCWEYFFYTGILFRIQAITILFFYCIVLMNKTLPYQSNVPNKYFQFFSDDIIYSYRT